MLEREKPKEPNQHWPFDPMQPGDHEPVDLPDEPIDVEDTPKDLDTPRSRPQTVPKR
jgi:hypothetical protein